MNRRANEDSPARQRERRAAETKEGIAAELRRLAEEEHRRETERDLEEAERLAEQAKYDRKAKRVGDDLTPTNTAAPSELLGAQRRKMPGIGRPPWA